ncbi:MAG: glycosyltransferase family 2 protein [Candidatus Edwardsbacteria bacterium]
MDFELSLIITTYNQPQFLNLVLASVSRQSISNFEVLIADDGSGKETKDIIEGYEKRLNLKHIWHPDQGYRKSIILNKAVNASSSDYLVFIDGDCILHRDFLEDHLSFREVNHFLAGRRVELGEQLTEKISANKILQGYFDRFNLELLVSNFKNDSRHFNRSIPVRSQLLRKLFRHNKVPDILGSNFSLYKRDLISVNGFNESLTHYWGEDGDLFLRLRNSGYKIKSIKGVAIQFHLYHKRRRPDKNIVEWYYRSLGDYSYKICKKGFKTAENS